jgi:hypothetical protein
MSKEDHLGCGRNDRAELVDSMRKLKAAAHSHPRKRSPDKRRRARIQASKSAPEMTAVPNVPPAPVGQQGPPACAAVSAVRARRVARGSLLLTTGTAYRRA